MIFIPKRTGPLLAAAALIAAAPAGSADDPAAYAVRIPVTPAAGSAVQRLPVPPAALAAARTADLADLRVFDRAGTALPMARIAPAATPARRSMLPALPILGAADALSVTGVSLRLDGDGQARVAQVEGTVARGPATAVVLGVLLDARALAGTARSLTLDATMPAGQPVTFTIEASADLRDWRPLAEQVAYRPAPAAGGDTTGALALSLGDARLHQDYLRVTWRGPSRLLSPVAVRGAVLVTRSGDAIAGGFIDAMPPPPSAGAVAFALPFAAAIATVRVTPSGGDTIIPIRILGRDDREQPWAVMGQGTAARSATAAASAVIPLVGPAYRTMRIEPARPSPGFTSPPAIRFGFARTEIAFLATGAPPFTLAAGRAASADAYLPLASLMTQATAGPLPTATTGAAGTTTLELEPIDATGSSRQLLLWAMLLGATAVLGGMAWLLWRRAPAAT